MYTCIMYNAHNIISSLKYGDHELWSALDRCHLRKTVVDAGEHPCNVASVFPTRDHML